MGCGGSKSAAVSPDYPKKKDSIPKRTAPTSMSLEEKTALMEKFNAKLFDGTIADGTVTTADCTFNPPGAPAMPMDAFQQMTNGCKACFPDWTSKLCKVEEGPTPDTAICMTQQLMGCMKGDFPAMGPMPAVAMSEVPERCKTEELTLVVEVGLYTFKDGKVSKGEYKASGEFREDWKGNGGVEPSAFVSEHWPKGLVGFGVVFAWFEQLGKMPIPPGTIASRITIVPIKPGTKDKILAVMKETSGTIQDNPAFAGMKEVAAFFTDDDKMVGRTLFTDMDALTGSAEATKKVMGGMAEHFAGPPSMSMGTVDWHFKGPAAPVATPVSRVTIVPIKPGSQGAIMKKESMAAIEEGLKHPDMAGMIEVSVIFSGDTMLSRSLFTSMAALEGSVETQTRVMGTMKEHIAGPPTRLSGELAWHHTHGPPLGPVSERGAVSVALVPDDSYPAGFAVRIRPLLGISAGAPAEARCRVSYDVKGGARVDVVGLGRAEEATVQRLTAGFERAALDFAMASGASATSGSDADLWRKFVYWASKRDGGAGGYDELGRLGKPTTPERLVGVTGGARI